MSVSSADLVVWNNPGHEGAWSVIEALLILAFTAALASLTLPPGALFGGPGALTVVGWNQTLSPGLNPGAPAGWSAKD